MQYGMKSECLRIQLVRGARLCTTTRWLQYPSFSGKSKYDDFRTKVDDTIKAELLHLTPVIDDESFIKRYKALTRILKQCGEAAFGRVKRGGKSMHGKITSPKIQHIQAQIKNIGGALRMDNLNGAGKVSYASQRCYLSHISKFRSDPEKCADFRSFLILHRRKLYKSLYNERMSEFYTRAHEADKKRIHGTLLGGSSTRLMISG